MEIEQYLEHWWNGNLKEAYGLMIVHTNKVFKILQFFIGLLAIFEIMEFSKIMNKVKTATLGVLIARNFLNIHILLLWVIWRAINSTRVYICFKDRRDGKRWGTFVWESLQETTANFVIERPQRNMMVKFLNWLELNPIPQNTMKSFTYFLFVIITLGELITS